MSYVPPSSGVSRAGSWQPAWTARRHATDVVPEGAVSGGVRTTLRLEGLAVLFASVIGYSQLGAGWGAFAMLFLVPDLSFLGYLGGARTGAAIYNLAHSYVGPVALIALGLLADMPVALAVGLIWSAHIGFDRMLGYGLKYASGFAATHLGRIGPTDPW
ncbi:DUF4260 domain-containing protein [Variovorax sp. Sphag1AA]|uniref:DUF4260 domain-containing protein n=1 Tax=Variovorax sp. Sphag1AA TaxID=2587027 RepID=UPI001610B1C9|nr:DUF4260 domain-containing protein [Variovorax sp. Sphag1AA]MBB3180147.1 hypothetical protein [Variovorax sp. Sphag1AA]